MRTKILMMLLIILAASTGLVAAISVSMSGGSGGNVASTSIEYNLDGAFSSQTTVGQGFAYTDMSASGSGSVSGTSDGTGFWASGDDLTIRASMGDGQVAGTMDAAGLPIPIYADSETGSEFHALFPGKGGVGFDTSSLLTGPVPTSDGGNLAAYSLTGRKWTQANPNIRLYVNPTGSGFTAGQMWGATTAAAETWDAATNQELFSGIGTLTTATPGKYDGRNTLGFLKYNVGCNALASAGTWYSLTKVDGYYPIKEVDIAFNTQYKWSTTGEAGKIDFQSVALHELGHAIGMGDIYNKAAFVKDTRQVMHYYTGVKRTLGNGDKTGVWQLYH